MTYDELRVKVGRRPITVVELDLDFCTRTYGVAPCTASVPGTGPQKCFNTFPTCQDTANYNKGTKTYKFTEANAFLPIGENVFPCITGVDIAPTQLKPGAFSVSASVTVTLHDFPHHDRGCDPYVDGRTYDPQEQGTFFGKLLARNAVVANRPMRVITGYLDDNRVIQPLTRTYFIDRIEGPDANGRVKIVGKDLLRFAEIAKTKAPADATAYLSSGIGTGTGSVGMSPTGVGANYPTSGIVAIDDELMTFTRSGDTLTITGRNAENTTAVSHGSGSAIKQVFPPSSSGMRPCEVVRDLLLLAGIDSSYIPYSDWLTENNAYISGTPISTLFAEPEGIKTLIEEVLTDFGCAIWWDELDAEIKFLVISAGASAAFSLNDTQHILEGSLVVKKLENERFSRVQLNYGVLKKSGTNLVSDLSADIANTTRSWLVIDAAAESPNANDGSVPKNIVSRWLRQDASDTLVDSIADRYLDRYSVAPREVTFKLDAKDSDIRTGNVIEISSRMLQAPDGSQEPVKFLVTEFREVIVGSQYQYTALELPA